jgi:hypothetical protein
MKRCKELLLLVLLLSLLLLHLLLLLLLLLSLLPHQLPLPLHHLGRKLAWETTAVLLQLSMVVVLGLVVTTVLCTHL